MSKQRWIDTCFWDRVYIRKLKPVEKLLYLYFITNPLTNISGVYQIDKERMAFDSGIKIKEIDTILQKLQADGKIFYKDGWLVVRNFIKHQNFSNIKIQEGINRELRKSPPELKQYIYNLDTALKIQK